MKNQEQWDLAQRLAARQMIHVAIAFLLMTTIGLIYTPEPAIAVAMIIAGTLISVAVIVIQVERGLARQFPSNNE